MGFNVTTRWGADELNPTTERLREILAQLDVVDAEHQSVSLRHESERCLGAYPDGLMVWENVESDGPPHHMKNVSREKMLELWLRLAQGRIREIEAEAWLPGYEDS